MTLRIYLFSLVCLFAGHVMAADGVFMVVKGEIKVMSNGKAVPAKVGMKVSPSDKIISGKEGRAKIVMSDKNILNISPQTEVVIEAYKFDEAKNEKNVSLNVLYGKVRATVNQKYDGEKNKFQVKTPSAVAGVRGTDFLTSHNPTTNASKIVTFEGSVQVGSGTDSSGRIQNPVTVPAGSFSTASNAAPPSQAAPVPKAELQAMNKETNTDGGTRPDPNAGRMPAEGSDKKDKDKDDKKEGKENNGKKDNDKNNNGKNEPKDKEEKGESKEGNKEGKETKEAGKGEAKEGNKDAKNEPKDGKSEGNKEAKQEGEKSVGNKLSEDNKSSEGNKTADGNKTEGEPKPTAATSPSGNKTEGERSPSSTGTASSGSGGTTTAGGTGTGTGPSGPAPAGSPVAPMGGSLAGPSFGGTTGPSMIDPTREANLAPPPIMPNFPVTGPIVDIYQPPVIPTDLIQQNTNLTVNVNLQ